MSKLLIEKNIVYLDKHISILFKKIEIKFHLTLNNDTYHPMSLELLREETQILILTTVLKDLKVFIINILKSSTSFECSKDKIDVFIILIIMSSKRKILNKLRFTKENYVCSEKIENKWLITAIESEAYSTIIVIIQILYGIIIDYKFSFETYPSNLLSVLIENLTIKLSNFISYELFFKSNLSSNITKIYFRDYSIIDYDKRKLSNYLYWKWYLTLIFFNIKILYNQTHSITLLQKKGFITKKFYSSELNKIKILSNIEIIILGIITYIDFIMSNITHIISSKK